MHNNQPIGIFDSGIGGTSIWKEINQLLPNENTLYLADSANAPYGKKSKSEIIDLCCKNVDFLIQNNAKMIVVACNTATTNAIKELRNKYKIPFIGIEPAIKPAALKSNTKAIGILATQGTLNSELFHKQVENFNHIKIVEQVGHGLVELIESGKIDSPEMKKLLQSYVKPMIQANIDYLVLGCSHYPYLIPQIKQILPATIQIIDSGLAVAKQTHVVLNENNILNQNKTKGKNIFHTNSDSLVLKNILGFSKNVFQTKF